MNGIRVKEGDKRGKDLPRGSWSGDTYAMQQRARFLQRFAPRIEPPRF